jgi:hypothetical protein
MLEQSAFYKTEILTITNNDMVEYLDTHDFASFLEPSGNSYIFTTGTWITGRMLMYQYDCCCI